MTAIQENAATGRNMLDHVMDRFGDKLECVEYMDDGARSRSRSTLELKSGV